MKKREYILFSNKIEQDLNIAICSNIHFDENMKIKYFDMFNEYLFVLGYQILNQLKDIRPTHIVIPGDLFNSSISSGGYNPKGIPGDCVINFLSMASKIAPVYYAPGNTDIFFDKLMPIAFGGSFERLLDVYNKDWCPNRRPASFIDNSGIVISGLGLSNEFYMQPKKDKLNFLIREYRKKLEELSKFGGNQSFHVLLCHDSIIKDALEKLELNFDLIISSTIIHSKWLQEYLMKNGYDPNLLYSKYTTGAYECGQGKLIVSEGITKYHSNFGKIQALEVFHNGTIENVRVLKRKNNDF